MRSLIPSKLAIIFGDREDETSSSLSLQDHGTHQALQESIGVIALSSFIESIDKKAHLIIKQYPLYFLVISSHITILTPDNDAQSSCFIESLLISAGASSSKSSV
jgi:hypothetical protein